MAKDAASVIGTTICLSDRHSVQEAKLLYFAYTSLIAPERMSKVAPNAEFRFIAHLPEWGLQFPINDKELDGGLPSVQPEPGHTVWGAVFEVPDSDVGALEEIQQLEQRSSTTVEAMDRSGKRHQVVTHVYAGKKNGSYAPSTEYLNVMLAGSRHWSLPAGWIAGLEEHLGAFD